MVLALPMEVLALVLNVVALPSKCGLVNITGDNCGPFVDSFSLVPRPTRYAADHISAPLEDRLPPPPPPPLPPRYAATATTNDENLTEVSLISEESYFAHDEQTLVQSGSFRHFKVVSNYPNFTNFSDNETTTLSQTSSLNFNYSALINALSG